MVDPVNPSAALDTSLKIANGKASWGSSTG